MRSAASSVSRFRRIVLVAGFDDVPEASWKAYDLTTVVQDGHAMVAEAVRILQSMIEETRSTGGTLRIVPGRLVERSTTRRGEGDTFAAGHGKGGAK